MENDSGAQAGSHGTGTGHGPAAALALGGASPSVADRYLEEQTRLAQLQAKELSHELELRHWSMWVHHLSGLLKLTFEIGLAVAALALACFLGAAVWNAAHADGLVIESFNVPPDMAQRGLTGQVVAGEILDRLTELNDATISTRMGKSYAGAWGDDIKVEIPETGVSVGEAYRFLRRWLGHESHVSGSVWRDRDSIVITARLDGRSVTQTGPDSDLNGQLRKTAEGVFGLAEPYRYAVYLTTHGRGAEGIAIFRRLIASGSSQDRAWGDVGLARVLAGNGEIDASESARLNREAVTLDPGNTTAVNNFAVSERNLGHLEASLRGYRREVGLLGRGEDREIGGVRFPVLQQMAQNWVAVLLGAYGDAIPSLVDIIRSGTGGSYSAISNNLARTEIGAHDLAAARAITLDPAKELQSPDRVEASRISLRADLAAARQDWQGVVAAADAAGPLLKLHPAMRQGYMLDFAPLEAYARGRLGHIAAAEALIAATPADCDPCLLQHARIAELRGQHARADWWFARTIAAAPSIPVAYAEWGLALLVRGKPDDAIARFKLANRRGPHFADALEGWGEALMAKNQSHLALAKFEEANKYAPNWGRLHLKWGEALAYAGNRDEAKVQFARARSLDRTPSEKSELSSIH